jgi:glyoxylase-like metal-dependent hydrolase (beta-lactamase superfamily II)
VDYVTLISGGFSNCYLISEKNVLILVDVGSSEEVKNIVRYVNGLSPEEECPIVIFSTHFHIDHVAGISYLLDKLPGAEVAFYKKVKDFFNRKEKICLPPVRAWFGNLPPVYLKLNRHIPSLLEIKLDDKVGIPLPFLRERVSVRYEVHHWLGDGDAIPYAPDWRVVSTPGHTTDSACLWHEKKNILISGDTILNMDGKGELNLFCCSYSQIKRSFNDLRTSFKVKALYPGHGYPIICGDDLLSRVKVLK